MKEFVRTNPIWTFLIINYLISWSFLYPSYKLILDKGTITPLALIGLIGAYGPSIAAIVVQYIIDKNNVKSLIKKMLHIKAKPWIALFILILPITLYSLTYCLSLLIFEEQFHFNWLLAFGNIPMLLLVALPFGPMGEELGWRGFMLPKLLEKHSMIKSTFLVGLAWGVWHMASFTFPGAALPEFFELSIWTILLYFTNTIALSFIFSYVFIKTKGSVFYAILLHAFFNIASSVGTDFFGESEIKGILITAYILNFVLAGILGYFLIKKSSTKLINNHS